MLREEGVGAFFKSYRTTVRALCGSRTKSLAGSRYALVNILRMETVPSAQAYLPWQYCYNQFRGAFGMSLAIDTALSSSCRGMLCRLCTSTECAEYKTSKMQQ